MEPIGEVAAAGTSASVAGYSFSDKMPLTGTGFYRLKMSDIDGRYTYSPVRSVSIGNSGNTVYSLYPNPASGSTWLNSSSHLPEHITVITTDNNGREISHRNYTLSSGAPARINIAGVATGLYFLKITSGKSSSTQKLVVQ